MDKVPEYKFLDAVAEPNETCPIQILEGNFAGIIYKYGKISLEEVESGDLKVNMEVNVITSPEGFDQNTEEFTETVGEIFVDIIEKDVATTKEKKEPIDLEDDVHSD